MVSCAMGSNWMPLSPEHQSHQPCRAAVHATPRKSTLSVSRGSARRCRVESPLQEHDPLWCVYRSLLPCQVEAEVASVSAERLLPVSTKTDNLVDGACDPLAAATGQHSLLRSPLHCPPLCAARRRDSYKPVGGSQAGLSDRIPPTTQGSGPHSSLSHLRGLRQFPTGRWSFFLARFGKGSLNIPLVEARFRSRSVQSQLCASLRRQGHHGDTARPPVLLPLQACLGILLSLHLLMIELSAR